MLVLVNAKSWLQLQQLYASVTSAANLKIDDWPLEPKLQQAPAHNCDTLVQHAKHTQALLGLTDAHDRGMVLLLKDLHATNGSKLEPRITLHYSAQGLAQLISICVASALCSAGLCQ